MHSFINGRVTDPHGRRRYPAPLALLLDRLHRGQGLGNYMGNGLRRARVDQMIGHFRELSIVSMLAFPLVLGGPVLELIPLGSTGALSLHLHVGVVGELEQNRIRQVR